MPPPIKRRKTEPTVVEEINFDPSARQEYLTGFHKRKLERAKHARELAEKQARVEKLEARKQVGEVVWEVRDSTDFTLVARRTKGRP
jgi:ribosomal RNA-processing protein 17